MKTIKVTYIRHGETLFNRLNRMQGWCDAPLTEKGIAQLQAVGQQLHDMHYSAIYSSDLKRAVDTAEILRAEMVNPPILRKSAVFREVYFGGFEGANSFATWGEVASQYGCQTQNELVAKYSLAFARDALSKADPLHLAEDMQAITDRLEVGFQRLLAENEDQANVLVVTHGTLIKTLGLLYDPKLTINEAFPRNGSLTTGELSDAGLVIRDFNRQLTN